MAKRFCESCGKELEDNSLFCTGCGAKVVNKEKKKEDVPTNKKSSKKGTIIAIIILILIALILFLVWFFVIREDNSSSKEEKDFEKIIDKVKDNAEKEQKEIKDRIEKEQEVKEKFNGWLYPLNDDYAWIKDGSTYYYLINKKGEVINKVNYSYSSSDPVFYDGYSEINDTIYNTKGAKVLSKDDGYESLEYTKKGFVIVEIKEENYKGTTEKMGIYDLNKKEYNMSPIEGINRISYLGEGMFLINPKSGNNRDTEVYNTKTKTSFSIGDRFDVLFGEFKDGYIGFRDINSDEVYLLGTDGTKKLIYKGDRHVAIGQYNDGLIYVKDSFYDKDGNKVINLKDEGIKGVPQFVNGYALVYFNTGYFTILSKETKEYVFTPRKYTEIGSYYSGDYELGIYEKQYKLSESGHLIVKTSENEKAWAIMDHNGKIVYTLPAGVSVFSQISDSGYIAVDGKEDYYITENGKKIEINN